jgi:DNA-directed RNA polymerase subunit RPC12/RpoP
LFRRAKTLVEDRVSNDCRKTPGLNIYINRFPEWSRRMSPATVQYRKKAGRACPKCGSPDTRESPSRRRSDFLMFLFNYSNARCRSCQSRFRIWKNRSGGPETTRENSPVCNPLHRI